MLNLGMNFARSHYFENLALYPDPQFNLLQIGGGMGGIISG
jgi:hypothetical protein